MTAGPYRRVILKPEGLTEQETAKLREGLAAAVQLQRRISAGSPHVLQFGGGVQETSESFFVEHEPAEPLDTASWFDPAAPGMGEGELLRWTAAIFDALRAAHSAEGPRTPVHGGLCGGVLLVADGIEKITDFGFAPALCAALGAPRYLHLAVARPPATAPGTIDTGAWELLAPDTYDRDDRICSFIDPDKYGTRTFDSFEPGSDVIAAGFILHFMAEHRHPYLSAEPEAHRIMELCEYMAQGLYNRARRPDLGRSSDAAVQAWCEQVAKALERRPLDRPRATDVLKALAAHGIKPLDAGVIAERRLMALGDRVAAAEPNELDWRHVLADAEALLSCKLLPDRAAEKARSLARQAGGHSALQEANQLLAGESWKSAGEVLRSVDVGGVGNGLARRLEETVSRFERFLALDVRLEEVEAQLGEDGDAEAAEDEAGFERVQSKLGGLKTSLEATPDGADLPEALRVRRDALLDEIRARMDRAVQEAARLRAEREAGYAVVREWMARLNAAWEAEHLDELEALLVSEPQTRDWPPGARELAGQRQRELQNRRKVQTWKDDLEAAVAEQRWADAELLLHEELDDSERTRELRSRVKSSLKEQEDRRRARAWSEALRTAVESQRWDTAADVLYRRPDLEYWPPDAIDAESICRPQIEERLEEIETQRRRVEAEQTRAREWLEAARSALDDKNWEKALGLLTARPALDHWPEGLLAQADELERTCRHMIGVDAANWLKTRTQNVVALCESFVHGIVHEKLGRFVHPRCVQIIVDEEQFTSPEADADGRAQLRVRLADEVGPVGGEVKVPFDFHVESVPPRICGDTDGLRELVADKLEKTLAELQRNRADNLRERLARGLFSNAGLDLPLSRLTEKASVRLDLGGGACIADLKVAWDREALHWTLTDAARFHEQALDIALRTARNAVLARVLERSAGLRAYRPFLSLVVTPPTISGPGALPFSLSLEGHLRIQWGSEASPQVLQSFNFTTSQVGKVNFDADLSTAEQNLRKLIIAGQNAARDGLAAKLQKKLDAAHDRAKLTVNPKKIKEPIEEIEFVAESRGKRLVVPATWNCESLEYRLPEDADARLSALFNPPPAAKQSAPKKQEPIAAKPAKEQTAPLGKSRVRSFVALGVVGVAAIVVLGLLLVPKPKESGRERGIVPANDNAIFAGQNANTASPPENANTSTLPSPASFAEALNAAKARLDRSKYLKPHKETLAIVKDAEEGGSPSIEVSIPGLNNSPLVLALETAGSGANVWQLGAGEIDRLDGAIALLEEKLKLPAEAVQLASAKAGFSVFAPVLDGLKDLVDPSRIAVLVSPDPDWILAQDRWRSAADARLLVDQTGGEDPASPLSSAEVSLVFEMTAEQVSAIGFSEGHSAQSILAAVGRDLTKYQDAAAHRLGEELSGAACQVSDHVGGKPAQHRNFSIACEDLQPRVAEIRWDRSRLQFDKEVLAQALNDALRARTVLERLNAKLPDWIQTLGGSRLKELQQPDTRTWTLGVPAPWDGLLPLKLGADPFTSGEAPEVLADRILAELLPKPDYWPLVEKYAAYTQSSPASALRDDLIAQASAAERAALAGVNNVALAIGLNSARVEPGPEGPAALMVEVQKGWSLVEPGDLAPEAADQMRQQLAGLTSTAKLTLRMERDKPTWSAEDHKALLSSVSGDLTKISERLASLAKPDPHRTLEAKVEGFFQGGRTTARLDERTALDVLGAVWDLKKTARSTAQNMSGLTQAIRRELNDVVTPTIFAEYFRGVRFAYALVWSADANAAITEGPTLVRLGETDQAKGGGGPMLIGSVLDEVRAARAGADFDDQVGVVFGLDEWVPRNFADLQFATVESSLGPRTRARGGGKRLEKWSQFSDFTGARFENRASTFWPVKSLADVRAAW